MIKSFEIFFKYTVFIFKAVRTSEPVKKHFPVTL